MSEALRIAPDARLERYEQAAQNGDWSICCGDTEAAAVQRRWEKFQRSNRSDSKLFLAQEHGFVAWPDFAAHVRALANEDDPIARFEAGADAVINGDERALRELIQHDPGLISRRSTREHRSTLLHYVSANGVEDFRQNTPPNILDITKLLLDAGADVNAESDAYGGRSTTLGLVATSVHPQRAGVQIDLLQMLLEHGAEVDEGLIAGCMANGQPAAARFFERLGVRMNLEGAAALGRLDEVQSLFPMATAKQREAALLYASGYGRTEAVEFLLDNGVDPASRNRNGHTPLHWAASRGHQAIVEVLLEGGAPVDVQDDLYQATPLDSAVHARDGMPDPSACEQYDRIIALLRAAASSNAE